MADDLYKSWLGIPPGERPPDHYTLLGLPQYCADEALIEAAAQKRLEELDRRALHPDPILRDQCQEMMNQTAQARVVLKSEKKRTAYNVKQFGFTPQSPAPEPVSTLFSGTSLPLLEKLPADEESEKEGLAALWKEFGKRSQAQQRLYMAAVAIFLLVLVGAAILIRHIIVHQPEPPRYVDHDERPATRPAATQTIEKFPPAPATAPTPSPPTPPPAVVIVPPPTPPATQAPPKSIFDDNGPSHNPATNPAVAIVAPAVPATPVVTPAVPPIDPQPVVPAPPPTPPVIVRIAAPPDAAVLAARQQLSALADASPQKLLKEAIALDGKNVEAKRFALLQMLRERAIAGGLLNTALSAIDELDKRYVVDTLSLKADALDAVTKGTTSVPELQSASKTALDLSYAAGDAKRYDLAERLATVALRSSRGTHDVAATRRETLRIIEVEKLKSATP